MPPVLLCYEPEGELCHRHVLSGCLWGWGVEIGELEPGDLPQRRSGDYSSRNVVSLYTTGAAEPVTFCAEKHGYGRHEPQNRGTR